MPHRVGFLYEKMIALENCIQAEVLIGKNKPDNRMARYISSHAESYGKDLHRQFVNGTFHFHESRKAVIKESYKGKTRNLLIPCLEDQAAEQAWLLIATPYIERRNYYYNCGSIPNAGQTRATDALRKWLSKKNYKYGMTTDIRHFYETCPHTAVIRGLRRIFKDERFVQFAQQMMDSMSPAGVGLAIGHPVSHWLANVALMEIDHEISRRFPDVRHARYMDDMAFLSNNKRHLRQVLQYIQKYLGNNGMQLKNNWQIFRIEGRGLQFLSYRFFYKKTVLTKRLMYRIARKMRRASKHMSVHMAMGVVSYIGILKHCDSYNFRVQRVYPYVNPKRCRRLISNASKDNVCRAA